MRIVSTFRDYYDSVQKIGQDHSVVYVRKPEKVKVKSFPFDTFRGNTYYWDRNWPFFKTIIIGFCGKVYPCLKVKKYNIGEEIAAFCYNTNDVDKFIQENFTEENYKTYCSSKIKNYGRWPFHQRRQRIDEFYHRYEEIRDRYCHIFEEKKSPIFIAQYNRQHKQDHVIVYNGHLGEFEFYRVFDPYLTFQEMYSYMSNMAMPNRPIPEIDDETLSQAKGFDKFSFRKEPGKKKRKR